MPETTANQRSRVPNACPLCDHVGQEVPRKVLYQHLDARGILDIFQWKESLVCLNPDCACLYFSDQNWVSHQRCNKPVGFKNHQPPRLFCYCFGYTAEEILKRAETGTEKPILDQIGNYLQNGAKLCQSTNPTGRCCLPLIQDLLKNNPR